MNAPISTVLQVHNVQSAYGGADLVIDNERRLLESNDVRVVQYLPSTAELSTGSSLRMAQVMVVNTAARRALQTIIDDCQPDVVHFHTVFPLLSPEVLRVQVPDHCVRVVTLHSYRFSCLAATHFRHGQVCTDCAGKTIKLSGLRHRCYHNRLGASAAAMAALAVHRPSRTLNAHVDSFFALTPFQASLLAGEGVDAHRIQVKPNFLVGSFEEPRRMTERDGVVFVGRLNEEKGIRQLLQAWEDGMPRLRIAGDGPLRSVVEAAARRFANIDYLGPVAPSDIHQLLAGSRLLVFPSLWFEGMPMVLLEALGHGCPILVSDLSNLRSIAGPEAVAAFPVGSTDGIRLAVQSLIDDVEALGAMSAAGHATFMDQYSVGTAWSRLMNAYQAARSNKAS